MEPGALHTLQALTLGEPRPSLGSPFHCKDPSLGNPASSQVPFQLQAPLLPMPPDRALTTPDAQLEWSLRLETPTFAGVLRSHGSTKATT